VGTDRYYPYLLQRFARNPKYLKFIKHIQALGGIRHQVDPALLLYDRATKSTVSTQIKGD
jgi:hypothetical protein